VAAKPKKPKPDSRKAELLTLMETGPLSRLIINMRGDVGLAQTLAAEGLIHLNADYASILRPGRAWLKENANA
jgi:hypothetical protein